MDATWNPAWHRVKSVEASPGWHYRDPRRIVTYEFRRQQGDEVETKTFWDLTEEQYRRLVDETLNWIGGDPDLVDTDSS